MKKIILLNWICISILSLQLSCSSNDDGMQTIDCSQSTLAISLLSSIDASGCTTADGVITVDASGGEGPYTFEIGSINNNGGTFDGLTAGDYEVKVTDGNSCVRLIDVSLSGGSSTLSLAATATPDTDCLTGNGTITATETGGVGPYEFKLNNGSFGSSATFTALKAGNYTVEVKDSGGCSFVKDVTIVKGETGVSFSAQIKPIINTKCALSGCHNGDNGASRNWTVFSNVKSNAANIKTRTGNRSMPQTGSLTQDQIDLIACWVDDGAKDN
ncbi:MAG: hypothetical protein WAU36_04435 [Cyclobacteriaceae bacterium]